MQTYIGISQLLAISKHLLTVIGIRVANFPYFVVFLMRVLLSYKVNYTD